MSPFLELALFRFFFVLSFFVFSCCLFLLLFLPLSLPYFSLSIPFFLFFLASFSPSLSNQMSAKHTLTDNLSYMGYRLASIRCEQLMCALLCLKRLNIGLPHDVLQFILWYCPPSHARTHTHACMNTHAPHMPARHAVASSPCYLSSLL